MAQQTYPLRCIVLRKTKLGESDLIVTLLGSDGAQTRAVAKGARKPTSPFASRLELYSECDALIARGRSLDIVKEARLVSGNDRLRRSPELFSCASVVAELLDKTTQADLENERLYALSSKTLRTLNDSLVSCAVAVTAAHALKTFAFLGVRPRFEACVACGAPISGDRRDSHSPSEGLWFSCLEGGVLCPSCRKGSDAHLIDPAVTQWGNALLMMTLEEAAKLPNSLAPSFSVLSLCREWTRAHFGFTLKSLEFLFTCGLF